MELDPLKRAQVISMLNEIAAKMESAHYPVQERKSDAQTLKTICAKL